MYNFFLKKTEPAKFMAGSVFLKEVAITISHFPAQFPLHFC